MKKLLHIFIILTISSLNIFSQTKNSSKEYSDPSPLQFGIYNNTPLIALIANPEKYHGKIIQVVGYLNLEFEGNAVFLHKDDFEYGIYENSFWVNFSDQLADGKKLMDYSNKYVYIIGTFNMHFRGHMDMFGGSIDNIVRLQIKEQQRKR